MEYLDIKEYKVSVYPTRIIVDNYELKDAKNIEGYLSVWNKIYFKHTFFAFNYDEKNKRMIFPAGINLSLLLKTLGSKGQVDFKDYRFLETNFKEADNYDVKMNFPPRDLLQNKAIQFLTGRSISSPSTQKFLSLNTGEGKTFCALSAVISQKLIPFIFVSNNKLKEQWEEKIIEYTGIDKEKIFIIQGKSSINRLLKMKSNERKEILFYIIMYKTINTFIDQDEDNINELILKTKVGIKVFDEAHLDFRSLVKVDLLTDLPSIYLSATPKRSDQSEDIVFQNIFSKIPKYNSDNYDYNLSSDKRSIPKKYHNVVVVKFNSKPSEVNKADFMKASNKKGLDVIHYSKYLMEDEDRKLKYFKLIFDLINEVIMSEEIKKTVVMFKMVNMIEEFYKYLEDNFGHEILKKLDCIRFYDGADKKEKERLLDSSLIITTDLSLGTGIDIPHLRALINTVPLSSDSKVTQIMGRLRYIHDKEVTLYDVSDTGFNKLVTQTRNRINDVYKHKAKELITFKIE